MKKKENKVVDLEVKDRKYFEVEVKSIEISDSKTSLAGKVTLIIPGKEMNWLLTFPIFKNQEGRHYTLFPGEEKKGDVTYYNIVPEVEGHWIEQNTWAAEIKACVVAIFQLYIGKWEQHEGKWDTNCGACRWRGSRYEYIRDPQDSNTSRKRYYCKVINEYVDEEWQKYLERAIQEDSGPQWTADRVLSDTGHSCPHHTWFFQTKEGKWVIRDPFPNNVFVEDEYTVRMADVRIVFSEGMKEKLKIDGEKFNSGNGKGESTRQHTSNPRTRKVRKIREKLRRYSASDREVLAKRIARKTNGVTVEELL